jgi:hypothetical protein
MDPKSQGLSNTSVTTVQVYEMSDKTIPSNVTTEYEAMRAEIVFRLKVQQDMINYTFVTAGLLATLLGLYDTIPKLALLIMLLLGPLVIVFIQFVYFKQHIFTHTLANYISTALYYETSQDDQKSSKPPQRILPFGGWETFLTSYLYKRKLPDFYSSLLSYAEGGFPTLIGIFYLAAFAVLSVLSLNDIPVFLNQLTVQWKQLVYLLLLALLALFLIAWCASDLILLASVTIVGILIRRWVRKERESTAEA